MTKAGGTGAARWRAGAVLLSALLMTSLGACGDGGSKKQASDAAVTDAGTSETKDAGKTDAGKDAAVGGKDAGTDMTPRTVMVGAEGGMVMHASGASIEVPAGALASPVELTIQSMAAPNDETLGGTALGQAFVLGPEGQTFLKPITIRVPFDPTRVPSGFELGDARIVIAPQGSTSFATLETTADLAGRTLTAQTTHFSIIAPIAPASPNPLLVTTQSPLPEGQVGLSYGPVSFAATGGTVPLSWSLASGSSLPAGLTLSSEGVLSGNPAAWGAFTFSVRVSDAAKHVLEKAFALTIREAQQIPVPVVSSISPISAEQGAQAFTLTVNGQAFVTGATVYFGTTALTTSYVSATQLTAMVPANALATAGKVNVYVSNPGPGGGNSESQTFTITASNQNPQPILSSISPNSVLAGAGDTQISLSGSSFINGSVAVIGGQGGQALTTTFVSATELQAVVPASSLANAGTLSISVFTPAPGGGYSPESIPLTVGTPNPTPVLSSISPDTAGAGSGDLTLTVTGSSFVSGAKVYFDQTALTTTFNSATSLSAALPSTLLSAAANVNVTVVNPMPGGGTSAAKVFTIKASSGDLVTSMTPSEARAGSDDLLVNLQGSAFGTMTRVSVDGGATFLRVVSRSKTSINFVLPKANLASVGTLNVVLEDSGSLSAPESFKVVNTGTYALPTLNSFSPNSIARAPGTSVSFSFTGSNFTQGKSQLFIGDRDVTFYTTFAVSSGSVSMSQSNAAANFPLAGTYSVRVVNPSPGGGSSNAQTLTVTGTNPAPDITSIVPSTLGTGTPTVTFDVYYTSGYYYDTQVRAEKGGLYKEFCEGYTNKNAQSVCLMELPAAFFETPGDITFTMTNPAPGGGTDSVVVSVVQGNPTPVKATPSVYQIPTGSGATTVSLTGGPFVQSTTVLEVNSATNLDVTYVNAGQIDVLIPQTLLASAGTLKLRATNPGPGGGDAPDANISVVTGPKITSVDPNTVSANSGAGLTIMGENLNLGDYRVLQWRMGDGPWTNVCTGSPEASPSMWFLSGCSFPTVGTVSIRAFIEGYPESNELPLTVQ